MGSFKTWFINHCKDPKEIDKKKYEKKMKQSCQSRSWFSTDKPSERLRNAKIKAMRPRKKPLLAGQDRDIRHN